ncbi:MAG: rRNA pseudouridine synthase [Clostridioides sp.]|nr:rRNA pseudouridine synthase [Clostridioides sp.]
MRINKYIASCGVASRRKAEELINSGRVLVNGKVVEELSLQIDEKNDEVQVDGKVISLSQKDVYIALYKPEGYITTVKDQFNRPSVLDLLTSIDERLYPVGRLDYETSGLLILTNDGDLTYKLTHPKHNIDKVYRAKIKGRPSEEEISRFEGGIHIEDYVTAKARLKVLKESRDKGYSVVDITIHEGRNRQVRKMCKAIGHPVLRLQRINMGKIGLKDLKPGEFRHLSEDEIKYLKDI